MSNRVMKIYSKGKQKLELNVTPGHFATANSHVNYFIDLSYLKTSSVGAKAAAKAMSEAYSIDTDIQTIVCIDYCEIIGTYLAQELIEKISIDPQKELFIISPKFNSNGQTIFDETLLPQIKNHNILLLTATTTTGTTIRRVFEYIDYHGGKVMGISAIFSAIDSINNISINSLFNLNDIPDYQTYFYHECPYCKKKIPLDGIINFSGSKF
ncbi:orotate phosphoribosyltransferase [Anaerosacchariphilus polymeriproducens]|uniref:Orotate phosphoribosyltransferase n=1 Tax=Anaerosacchariphilus polymeriproducens TaxID=1812858 RepID=A0A371AY01_9FIRM|nr:orotate phosphoribosyltransferase [Anaerosacchariphilus polymeriproducens]RDU24443.1 orotate phosphoribosyltransferase [Anaerosacchariphilus polymeriproducens]